MLKPFHVEIPDAALRELRSRLEQTRFLSDRNGDGWEDGTDHNYLRELVQYWHHEFDWRVQEKLLNRFNHMCGRVDGTDLHLIHERGVGPSPLPILLLHGYPDSFYRFVKLLPLLSDPQAHGGDAVDAFDVIVPSLPGYAFSESRTKNGGAFGFGDLLHKLMAEELGYPRYAVHGGDWGGVVTELLARSHSSSLVGIHLTDVPFFHIFRKPDDDQLSLAEKKFFKKVETWQREEGAYAMIQGTRPRTISPGLNDSPAGLAAWIVEKFRTWSDCSGDVERAIPRDRLLANISFYWFTGAIGSSFWPYYARMHRPWPIPAGSTIDVPTGYAQFPKEILRPPRSLAARAYTDIRRWTVMPRGGHFAALEQPEALATEIREFFRPLRR